MLAAAHTTQLLRCVDDVLREAGVALSDLNALAATIGPGSFTGLRTGLATVKAFASALGIPIAPIPTLHAVARAEGTSHTCVKALLPAGRNEVFAQSFSLAESGTITELDAPRHISPQVLFDQSSAGDIFWVGDGARAYIGSLSERASKFGFQFRVMAEVTSLGSDLGGWRIASPPETPLAIAASLIALKLIEEGKLVSAEGLQALYVRLSDAEIKERLGK